MTLNAEEIVIGANGNVFVAEVGATVPDDISEALDTSEWTDVGYLSEDGVQPTDDRTIADVMAWQSFYPVRRHVQSRAFELAFELLQWNAVTIPLAFGGGEITEPSTGNFNYDPPAPEVNDERALVVEWSDGDKDYRLVLFRGNVSEAVSTTIARTDASGLPITFSVLGTTGESPYQIQSNDPAWEAAS